MSEKHYKWKDIGKPPQRLNAFLTPKKELPTKFAPSRDRSQSVDKLFNNSRSRLHSSAEMQALNQTREDSFRQKPDHKEESKKKEDLQDKKASLSKFPTLSLMMQQSSITAQNKHSGLIVTQLKKQFWAFKQNVLRELDRQKELVLKFVKEIVLTMEVEMEKIAKMQGLELKNTQSSSEKSQTKTLEDWKSSLANIKLVTQTAPASNFPKTSELPQPTLKAHTSPAKFSPYEANKVDTALLPPSIPMDLTKFLSSITKLKTQFAEMDKLFQIGQSKKGVKS